MSQALFIAPVSTRVTRSWGTRTTLLIGVALVTTSFIGASFATAIWHLFLSQGICFGWGAGFLFVGSVGIIPQWFTTRRSLANGIGTAGSGFGGLVYSLGTNAMIDSVGLPWAFRIIAVVAFMVNFICAILMRDRNKQVGSSELSFDMRLFRRPEFWLLLGFGSFSMLGYVVLLYSIPNYANRVGLTSKQASVVGAILNLGQGLGRPAIGYFSDSVGRINMAGTMTALAGVLALVLWTFAKSYAVLIFYALVGGTVAGTFWTTVGPVTAEVVGLKELPAALSITWVVLTLPTTCKLKLRIKHRMMILTNFTIQFRNRSVSKSSPKTAEATSAHRCKSRYVLLSNHLLTKVSSFTGVMYLAGAFCLWMLKAWKLGQLESIEAAEHQPSGHHVDPMRSMDSVGPEQRRRVKTSPFFERMIRWQKV
jgi:MFS family permease